MIAVIAPEPADWLAAVVDVASRVAPVRIVAPWAAGPTLVRLSRRLPAPVSRFVGRRRVPGAHPVISVPGWSLAEAGVRLWQRGLTDRAMRARLVTRHAVDAWATRWLGRVPEPPRLVIAPSLAARRTFARAADLGITTFLLEDIPGIRQLHADLDRAAQKHPGCAFLRRYRAPDRALVRQEVERALADHLIVRGAHARAERERTGVPGERIVSLPPGPLPQRASLRPVPNTGQQVRVRLAGLAAARHGTVEALAALAGRPHLQLVIRAGEGLEPPALLRHPHVVSANDAHLDNIDVVIAPAWCESYPREVILAGNCGIPVIATRRAAAFVEPQHEILPGDSEALGRALDHVCAELRAGRRPKSPNAPGDDSMQHALDRALA